MAGDVVIHIVIGGTFTGFGSFLAFADLTVVDGFFPILHQQVVIQLLPLRVLAVGFVILLTVVMAGDVVIHIVIGRTSAGFGSFRAFTDLNGLLRQLVHVIVNGIVSLHRLRQNLARFLQRRIIHKPGQILLRQVKIAGILQLLKAAHVLHIVHALFAALNGTLRAGGLLQRGPIRQLSLHHFIPVRISILMHFRFPRSRSGRLFHRPDFRSWSRAISPDSRNCCFQGFASIAAPTDGRAPEAAPCAGI